MLSSLGPFSVSLELGLLGKMVGKGMGSVLPSDVLVHPLLNNLGLLTNSCMVAFDAWFLTQSSLLLVALIVMLPI